MMQLVPRFCIDKGLLGTSDHLVIDEDAFAWSKRVPKETWHLSGEPKDDSDRCLDTVLRLANNLPDLAPPPRFINAMSVFSGSLGETSIPWSRVMPTKEHQSFTRRLINTTKVAMATAPLDYYRTVWVSGNAVFKTLKPVMVNKTIWNALMEKGEGNMPAVRSFEPNRSSYAPRISYDRFKTLTGRLTVERGPQILTLKREHRSLMKSSFGEDGSIMAFDFAALEARILLYEYGRSCDEVDLYGMIARELNYDRKAVKGAVIAELYGMSTWALGKHLGIEGKELTDFIKKLRIYFNTSELLSRVKQQFVATGKVINRYGRPVTIDEPLDNIFISYYGQSTGVDVTMMGFKQVVDILAEKAPRVRPLFLLHDAILLDVPNDDIPVLQEIKHLKVKGYVQKFPLKLEKIA